MGVGEVEGAGEDASCGGDFEGSGGGVVRGKDDFAGGVDAEGDGGVGLGGGEAGFGELELGV